MGYTKQIWHDEVIPGEGSDTPESSDRLGHMEDGIFVAAATADAAVAAAATALTSATTANTTANSAATSATTANSAASANSARITNIGVTSVMDYAAKGDGVRVFGAVAATGSPIVTATGAAFTSADVGKIAVVYNASGAGSITTILSVQSPTQVTLNANAGITTLSTNGYLIYGTDDSTAIQNALNAAAVAYIFLGDPTDANQPTGTGRAPVLLPRVAPGNLFLIAAPITIPSGVAFVGEATLANVLPSRNAYCVQVNAFAVIRRLELENIFGTGVNCGTSASQAHIYIDDIRVWHSAGSASAPSGLSGATSTTGGTLTANTRFYVVTAIDATGGETPISNEVSVTSTGTTSSNTLNWTAFAGAVSYRIYRGTTTGQQNLYFTSGTNSFTDTGGASNNGYPIGPGVALRLNGYHYEINTMFLKVAKLGAYHAAGSDCAVNIAYVVGCTTGVRCNASNQLHYANLFLDTCGGSGTLGGLVLDNGVSNSSFHVQAFIVNGVVTGISPIVNIGPLTSTIKNTDIRILLQSALTAGSGLIIANAADITVDMLLSNTAFSSGGGAAMTTAVVYGAGLAGELLIRAAISTTITPYSGTQYGTYRYARGGVEYSVQAATAPTVAALAANGTTAPAPTATSATDARGTVAIGSGTGPTAGAQVSVTFASTTGWVAAPKAIMLTPGNAATAALLPYVTSIATTGFQIGFANAPTASQATGTYSVGYSVQG